MFETNPKLGNKNRGAGVEYRGVCVECSKQTQNSETKNRGVGVEHRGVYVECSEQTQHSQTNPKLGKKIVGWALSIMVCAWNVRNKPKTRNQKIVGCTLVCKLFVPDVIKIFSGHCRIA